MNIGHLLVYLHIIIPVAYVRNNSSERKKKHNKFILACGCHPYGSIRKDCLQDTGQCLCHSYTTGRQCDKCLDSSLILTDHGCINCM